MNIGTGAEPWDWVCRKISSILRDMIKTLFFMNQRAVNRIPHVACDEFHGLLLHSKLYKPLMNTNIVFH